MLNKQSGLALINIFCIQGAEETDQEVATEVPSLTEEEIENLQEIKEILENDFANNEEQEEEEFSTEISVTSSAKVPVGEKPTFFYFFQMSLVNFKGDELSFIIVFFYFAQYLAKRTQ